MIRHHYTLEHVARTLTSMLRGATLVEAWTQEKYTLAMVFAHDGNLRTIVVDVSPNGGSFTEQPQLRRARSNTLDMFRELWNQPVALVTKHPEDRVISMWFAQQQLHCEFFSSGNGNIVLAQDGVITDALRDASERCGTQFSIHAPSSAPLWSDPLLTAVQTLARSAYQLGPWYAEETCLRSDVATDTRVSQLSFDAKHSLELHAQQIQQECLATDTYYFVTRGDARLLSLVPLRGWEIQQTTHSVLDGVQHVIRERHRIAALRATRATALRTATSELERTQRTIAAVTSDIVRDARSKRYRTWADILLTYPHQHERDRTSIELQDFDGNSISIPLNPAHSIIENATRLYSKARAAEVASLHREQRIPELERRVVELQERIRAIENASTPNEITTLLPNSMTQPEDQPRDEAGGRFRFFILDEQHCLYVGKNAANNDELTMKFAKQNDWWLHARGSAGSHAVLRGVEGDRIPKSILETAAGITAYYSQARNASWVSVVYTQRKYVRKPKGANVGAVVLEREQTVMVKPSIPT